MRLHLMIGCAAGALFAAAGSAQAATACAPEALNGLKVADLTVTEAKVVAATPQTPAHCAVLGTVVTKGEGAPDGLARFSLQLPEGWKQRFLFLGVGGNAGTLQPSANAVDRAAALGKGYAVILTDTGHVGDGTSANWVRKSDGSLDQAKVTDFLFRAAHNVTVSGKAFAEAYYMAPIQRAYFDGCSTGGRMALAAAMNYPGDFHGVISGDPAMDYDLNIARMAIQKAQLERPTGYIPEATLAAIDARITAECDSVDGAKDGIIQNPDQCALKPKDLQCGAGQATACLTADQVAILELYVAPLRDRRGQVAYPGWPLAHLVGPSGAGFYTFGRTAANYANLEAPWGEDDRNAPRSWRLGRESLTDWLGYGATATIKDADIDASAKVAGDELFSRTRAIMGPGEGTDPAKLKAFFARGGKMILYHGVSDPSITVTRTVQMYEDLAASMGGVNRTQASARLFLIPGMHHCGGGAGPDRFDTLSALEAWVEQATPPAAILASTRPEAPVQRQIPLCPYPQQARYGGVGSVNDAANWRCAAPTQSRRPS